MSSYQTITTTRLTRPDPSSLLAALRATVDPSAGIYAISESTYQIKTPAALTLSQMLAAQTAIDTAPAASPALTAQAEIDRLSIREKAILLALIDQLNVIRSKLPVPLVAITPTQAIAAARAKAGTL